MGDKLKVLVCTAGKHCRKSGGKDVYCALKKELKDWKLADTVSLKKSDCLGYCKDAPAVYIKQWKKSFTEVDPWSTQLIARKIAEKSVKKGGKFALPKIPALT